MIENLRPRRLGALLLAISWAIVPASQGDGANPADAVLQRYIEASGGADRFAALHSRVTQSTLQSGWLKVSAKTTQLWPDRVLVEAKLPLIGKIISSGNDGVTAWAAGDDGSPRKLQGRELQEFVLGQRLDRMVHLLQLYPVRRLLPGAAAAPQQVEMGTTFGTQELWTFDPATGLLQSTDGPRDEGPKKGVLRVVSQFDDYRKVDGFTLPFRAVMRDGKTELTIIVTKLDDDVPLDAAAIAAPAKLGTP